MKIHGMLDFATAVGGFNQRNMEIGGHTQTTVKGDAGKRKEAQQLPRTLKEELEIPESNVSLKFTIDKETGQHVIKVLNPETGDVIRQFPPEEFLHVAKTLRNLTGMLFSARL